ncbi:unnamed protein product [Gongylonema pulchrum]|uniref:Piwi domain-containing protein n=1 Tax=Gongylonema pulchrum TaxID=637853 RepID=A0A183D3V2_9BILA|nr:unnamed protein product [Gongylonema pulchrum]
MQEPRLHVAKFLTEHVVKAVRIFKETSTTRALPEHVVVLRSAHSNYRIYPEQIYQGAVPQHNVRPGTVVEKDIVHPALAEFIVVAHKTIMGTARPVRVTVLVDDKPSMSMDELVGMTNALCYAHGIVTSPTSLPAHLCAAADLAKRERNNFKTEQWVSGCNSHFKDLNCGKFRIIFSFRSLIA